jgi:DnaJ-class molecular chaperone
MARVRHIDDDTSECLECGSTDVESVDCHQCHGEGGFDSDDLMEEDPLWYDGVDWEKCDDCGGLGHYWVCWTCVDKARKASAK